MNKKQYEKAHNIEIELEKYSKKALIRAFINNNLFSSKALLRQARHEEFQLIVEKQRDLSMRMEKLDCIRNYEEYKKLEAAYMRYNRQNDKLLELMGE